MYLYQKIYQAFVLSCFSFLTPGNLMKFYKKNDSSFYQISGFSFHVEVVFFIIHCFGQILSTIVRLRSQIIRILIMTIHLL